MEQFDPDDLLLFFRAFIGMLGGALSDVQENAI